MSTCTTAARQLSQRYLPPVRPFKHNLVLRGDGRGSDFPRSCADAYPDAGMLGTQNRHKDPGLKSEATQAALSPRTQAPSVSHPGTGRLLPSHRAHHRASGLPRRPPVPSGFGAPKRFPSRERRGVHDARGTRKGGWGSPQLPCSPPSPWAPPRCLSIAPASGRSACWAMPAASREGGKKKKIK